MDRLHEGRPSHYTSLLDVIKEEERLTPDGIPISTIDSLMPRSDQAPFTEGEAFSGNIRNGHAEVSLTLAASPHFRPNLPLNDFVVKASEAFGQETKIPGELSTDQKVAPHMVVWWQSNHEGRDTQVNLFDLAKLPAEERADFIRGIDAQIIKAFSALDEVDGRPIIYGSWGHSEPESRARFGFSRGAPTLPDGHLHLAKVDVNNQDVSLSHLPTSPTLKHYQPWNRLINQQLGSDIAQMLYVISQKNGRNVIEGVHFYDNIVQHGNSHKSHQQGYGVTYQGPQPLQTALEHIVSIASEVERFYQEISALYAEYYKHTGDRWSQQQILGQIQAVGIDFGFNNQATRKLADFVTRITPTSGQLNEWASEIEQTATSEEENAASIILRQELARRSLSMARNAENENSMMAALVRDTYRNPRVYEAVHTWPAHSSAIYLFDDIRITGNKVLVNGFTVHPAIVSAAGAPEKLLGAAIVRDIGNTVQ